MLFDTDILIHVQKGNEKAVRLLENAEERFISIQTYMELMQNARNKSQHEYTREFLIEFGFQILPLTENIGHRASIYVEEYTLSCALSAADAIIAATATEHNLQLATSNRKHFKDIKDLKLKIFRA